MKHVRLLLLASLFAMASALVCHSVGCSSHPSTPHLVSATQQAIDAAHDVANAGNSAVDTISKVVGVAASVAKAILAILAGL